MSSDDPPLTTISALLAVAVQSPAYCVRCASPPAMAHTNMPARTIHAASWLKVKGAPASPRGISLNLNYHTVPKTNATATPVLRRITVRNVSVRVEESAYECLGLDDSKIEDIVFEDVQITGKGAGTQSCHECAIQHDGDTTPTPKC